MLDLASREERYFSINNAYTAGGTALGYAQLPLAVDSSGSSYYTLSVPSVTAASGSGTTAVAPGFTGLATPTGSQTADTTCYAYQIDQLGTQSNWNGATQLAGTGCW